LRRLLLLRPEPGLSASAERARALGLDVICCPLFRVEPVTWKVPEAAAYDGLLLTSANAVWFGGPALAELNRLPVHAVGPATAAAAREAGLRVETVGDKDAAALLEALPSSLRLLHLAGEDHRAASWPSIDRRIVYRSAPIAAPDLPDLAGLVAAVHSPRAGQRLAELATVRGATPIAAISSVAAEACGGGWERVETAHEPNDKSLLALAAMLCHTSPPT
jgi:uroporphyrinogen-III synthase